MGLIDFFFCSSHNVVPATNFVLERLYLNYCSCHRVSAENDLIGTELAVTSHYCCLVNGFKRDTVSVAGVFVRSFTVDESSSFAAGSSFLLLFFNPATVSDRYIVNTCWRYCKYWLL